jgi:hypothetical protein
MVIIFLFVIISFYHYLINFLRIVMSILHLIVTLHHHRHYTLACRSKTFHPHRDSCKLLLLGISKFFGIIYLYSFTEAVGY